MGTVDQHDASTALAGREDVLCALLDEGRESLGAGICCRIRIDQDFVSASQTLSFRQRKYFQLAEIERGDFHFDLPRRGLLVFNFDELRSDRQTRSLRNPNGMSETNAKSVVSL